MRVDFSDLEFYVPNDIDRASEYGIAYIQFFQYLRGIVAATEDERFAYFIANELKCPVISQGDFICLARAEIYKVG